MKTTPKFVISDDEKILKFFFFKINFRLPFSEILLPHSFVAQPVENIFKRTSCRKRRLYLNIYSDFSGITAVRYIAYDAAGNSAECTFDVIVVQKSCPSNDQIVVDGGRVSFGSTRMAPFTSKVVLVECEDNLYPIDNRPRFYVCDIMVSCLILNPLFVKPFI